MVAPTPKPRITRAESWYSPRRLGRNFAYIVPGFVCSLLAVVLIVPLVLVSVATAIIWVGALLMPAALSLASAFAARSRARLLTRGDDIGRPRYRPDGSGVTGLMARISDPRRWFDLLFETVIAFPMRAFNFVVAVVWAAGGVAGLTYFVWGAFAPHSGVSTVGIVLEGATGGAFPDSLARSFTFDVVSEVVVGAILLLTLPLVVSGLASLDALVTRAVLGTQPDTDGPGGSDPDETTPDAARVTPIATGKGMRICVYVAAAAFVPLTWPLLAAVHGIPSWYAMAATLVSSIAILLAIRLPYVSAALMALAQAAIAVLGSSVTGAPWPWPVVSIFAVLVLVMLVALRHSWHRTLAVWLAPQLLVVVVTALVVNGTLPGPAIESAAVESPGPASGTLTSGALANLIVSASVTAAAGVLMILIRQIVASRNALAAERRTSAELDAKQHELAERSRVAQELHDVVAHSMSVISIQATTAPYRLTDVDEVTRAEFASIADSSRQALTEMRGLLSVLRAPTGESPLAPQPEYADIPTLIETTRKSGASITFDDGSGAVDELDPASVPKTTGLAAYRIVQEALSNAVRHAPGAGVEVALFSDARVLTIDVANGEPGPGGGGIDSRGSGLGLKGIRERADAVGGTVEAGPAAGGGFRVRAVLPLN